MASTRESTWSNPFRNSSSYQQDSLEIAFKEFQCKFAEQRDGCYNKRTCGNKELAKSSINIIYIAFKGIEYEVDDIARVFIKNEVTGRNVFQWFSEHPQLRMTMGETTVGRSGGCLKFSIYPLAKIMSPLRILQIL